MPSKEEFLLKIHSTLIFFKKKNRSNWVLVENVLNIEFPYSYMLVENVELESQKFKNADSMLVVNPTFPFDAYWIGRVQLQISLKFQFDACQNVRAQKLKFQNFLGTQNLENVQLDACQEARVSLPVFQKFRFDAFRNP